MNQFGGSHTTFSVNNNNSLLNIHGNLTITTTTGQSDTEVYDYNVGGNVTLGAGAGIASQSSASLVGLENNQTLPLTNKIPIIPTIGGSVTVTGGTQPGLNPALNVFVGTNNLNQDFPLVIGNGVNANITGTGAANVVLNDLTVAGTSDIAFGSTTTTDTVNIRGDKVLTSFGTLIIAPNGSAATTPSTYRPNKARSTSPAPSTSTSARAPTPSTSASTPPNPAMLPSPAASALPAPAAARPSPPWKAPSAA